MTKPTSWKYGNLLILFLAACVLGAFFLRNRLATEPDWRLMPPSKANLFVQHPVSWLNGQCYAHTEVLNALTETAQTLQTDGIPVIVFALSDRHADTHNTGWTADLGYIARTGNGKFAQTSPALLSYGPFQKFADDGTNGSMTFDATATLALVQALRQQKHVHLESIALAPFALPLLQSAARDLPFADRAAISRILRRSPEHDAFMHVTFLPLAVNTAGAAAQ